ncbi:hypothetical protein [Trueperella pyogenes]|uniref:hypothetical protein n=1 Tax=Trueperella pyogenes TaxID=1661 RepID=UPI0023DDB785|nr:hypothetical protein [Trueperella pyogenes]
MKLYIRSRFSTRVLSIYAIFAIALVLLGSVHVHLPSFVTAIPLATSMTVFIAGGVSTVSFFSLHGGYPLFEVRSGRNIPALDLIVIACNVTVFFVITLLVHGCIPAMIILRALLGFVASAFLVTAFMGHYAGVSIPGILLIIFTLFGAKADGSGEVWAFAIADIDSGFSWMVVATLGFAGSYMWIRHYPVDSE